MSGTQRPLRILMVCDLWQRLRLLRPGARFPPRRPSRDHRLQLDLLRTRVARPVLRAARRLMRPFIVRDFNEALIKSAEGLGAASHVRLQGAVGRALCDRGRQEGRGARGAVVAGCQLLRAWPVDPAQRSALRLGVHRQDLRAQRPEGEIRHDARVVPAARLPSRKCTASSAATPATTSVTAATSRSSAPGRRRSRRCWKRWSPPGRASS